MSDYNAVLRQTDRTAASGYSYTRHVTQSRGDVRFDTPDIGSRNDASVVQIVPKTMPVKRYVVIDASQRDWVKQPNPYTDVIYSFGTQSVSPYPAPVYSNNPFVPTFGGTADGVLNTQPGFPNKEGWYFNNAFFPPYNSSKLKGNFIGYDNGYIIQPCGRGFGSVFTLSNVQSIKLIRAVLPQRQFLSIPILVTTPSNTTLVNGQQTPIYPATAAGYSNYIYDISNYALNTTSVSVDYSVPPSVSSNYPGIVQTNLGNKSYSTFGTYPYLLFNLNEYPGKYVGGNDAMTKAFSVMTQKTRTQTNFGLDVGVQHFDYEPWGDEAMVFQSPITNLLQLKISITDPVGNPFIQNDGLNITHIQTDANGLFLKCFTGTSQYFNNNELRIGDRVIFDPVTLTNIVKSTFISTNVDKTNLLLELGTTSFPVIQLLDYVIDPETGLFTPRSLVASQARTASYTTSYNGFLIPNFLSTDQNGNVTQTYPGAPDTSNYDICTFPILYKLNPLVSAEYLPFLNISLQPTYTLELVCLEPDTGQLGGKITQ
jgi:hypothetical protein